MNHQTLWSAAKQSRLLTYDPKTGYSQSGCDICSPGLGAQTHSVSVWYSLTEQLESELSNSYALKVCSECLNGYLKARLETN